MADEEFEKDAVVAIKMGGRSTVKGVSVEMFVPENMLLACSIRTVIFMKQSKS